VVRLSFCGPLAASVARRLEAGDPVALLSGADIAACVIAPRLFITFHPFFLKKNFLGRFSLASDAIAAVAYTAQTKNTKQNWHLLLG
jgi:hypothetical protein